jgi:multicomponent Na+:H+ antiporter subunit E
VTGRWLARLLPPALLLLVWVALQGSPSVGNLVAGAVVVAVVLWISGRRPREHVVHPWAALRFGVRFVGMLVESTWSVMITALRPTPERLRAAVVACPLENQTPLVATIVADAITLTPGTLTLDVRSEPTVLYVHVLGAGDPDEVRADVAALERLVVAAVEPRDPHPKDRGSTAGTTDDPTTTEDRP